MLIRIRSRDGLERVTVHGDNPSVRDLRASIEQQLHVPTQNQTLSVDHRLLLSKDPESFSDMLNPGAALVSLGVSHGGMVYMSYPGNRQVIGPSAPFIPAGSFGRKMTVDDMIARQMRIERQEAPHCDSLSFDRDAANSFQRYVNEELAFTIKRAGFMYGRVTDNKEVFVDFIYEPPQHGTETDLMLLRDEEEEKRVDLIAAGLSVQRVGLIFTQSVAQTSSSSAMNSASSSVGDSPSTSTNPEYTMSASEVRLAASLQAESPLKEFATAVVKLDAPDGDTEAEVHFEAFQLSDQCVRLFKEGWFEGQEGQTEEGGSSKEGKEGEAAAPADPSFSRMNKDVVVAGKDTREVDNDFFLVPVKIMDHEGPLSASFPVENRLILPNESSLRQHLQRLKSRPYFERLSDFHLLLFLSRFLDPSTDVPILADAVANRSEVPDGYQLIIESL